MKNTIIGIGIGIVLVIGGIFIYKQSITEIDVDVNPIEEVKTTEYSLKSNEVMVEEYHKEITLNGSKKAIDFYYILDKTYIDKADTTVENWDRGKFYSVRLVVYLNGIELSNDTKYFYGTSNDEAWVYDSINDINNYKENVMVDYNNGNYGVIKSDDGTEYIYYYTYAPYEIDIDGGLYVFNDNGSLINKIKNYSITDNDDKKFTYDNGYVINVIDNKIYYFGLKSGEEYWKQYVGTISNNKLTSQLVEPTVEYLCVGACSGQINIFE